MDASAHLNRARHLAAEPTTTQRQRAEAEGWRKLLRHRKSEELVHPLDRREAKLRRAERDISLLDASRLI